MRKKIALAHIAVRVPQSTIERADAIAKNMESTRSMVLRRALSIGLTALESSPAIKVKLSSSGDVLVGNILIIAP